ncbi:RNA methyltransferase tRNA(m5U54)methyltransferase [Steccherinum ochraceum]|uniref:tRNA (guanine(26)-N(2))-dimethyltransferase n=1 Tax=Steccherinum ochraceum TaxID=92696 RepID=A0A4R0RX05_9APHY|nr:RNA methyltransferase tRNA(m5U54)methyltransferase [Steccherinum ochraceum]
MTSTAEELKPQIIVPEGFKLHTENSASILLPDDNQAFLNPVQEFNRDLSVASIRTWADYANAEKKKKWEEKQAKKAQKGGDGGKAKRQKIDTEGKTAAGPSEASPAENSAIEAEASTSTAQPVSQPEYHPQKFVALEALSATGLRSIRYAHEIPQLKYIIANDLSPEAVATMRRNVDMNGLGERTEGTGDPDKKKTIPAKVKVNEGDACSLMFNHRAEKERVDVVDLDPYGTAAPFIDAAVQCLRDGGLLCVTCTDLPVLATNNFPEKCFSNYGSVPVKAEYCHEAALRIVLHSLSTAAARYGRYITPLLSLSIDFYVRLFVRVSTGANEVKRAISKTSVYYICTNCQSWYDQPMGKLTETTHANGNVNINVKTAVGPTVTSGKCPECTGNLRVAGPMWSGPLHDPDYVSQVLQHVEENKDKYGTSTRMIGMLTMAKEEINYPFYFTPSQVAGNFHCIAPSLADVASALLNAGHNVSRSHACAGSLKTDAPRRDLHDVYRTWIKTHPVKMTKIAEGTPAHTLITTEARTEANFKHHPNSVTAASKVNLVRYPPNPTPYWGPGKRAGGGGSGASGTKRKREGEEH